MKKAYIERLLASGVLRFGSFKTKSGRISPFFFNTGHIDSGLTLGAVADSYAALIAERFGGAVDNLYGPAYKGIPLAVMTAERLSRLLGRDISFTFNRKEAKDHGEGGLMVGRQYTGKERVVVVEDVITGGTSIRESLPLLRAQKVEVLGLVVGIDRQERGTTQVSALAEVSAAYDLPAHAIVTLDDVVKTLHNQTVLGKVWIDDAIKAEIDAYRAAYGAT